MNPTITREQLKNLREALGLTQEEMAGRLGIAREWVSKLENGKADISADVTLRYWAIRREASVTSSSPEASTGAVAEDQAIYGRPADRSVCEAYVRELFDGAEASADPNAFPYILRTLQKALPLGEFSERSEAERQAAIDKAKATMPALPPSVRSQLSGPGRKVDVS